MGSNARELVSFRALETLCVKENSNADNNVSVPGDKIEFNQSVRCEDVLRYLCSGVSSDNKMARPEVSKWDVKSFITKKRSSLPKCALQEIKDGILDSSNPLHGSLKAKLGLEVGGHSRDGARLNAVDINGMKQKHESTDAQNEHVLSENATPPSQGCTYGMQEHGVPLNAVDINGMTQSHEVRGTNAQNEHVLSVNATPPTPGCPNRVQENHPCVPPKRRIDDSTAHEGGLREPEPISKNLSGPCIKDSKKLKQEVASPCCNVVQDSESSQRDGVAVELSAGIPQAIVQKGNWEIGSLSGSSDGSERAASEMEGQSIDSTNHEELLHQRMSSEGKIQIVESSSKAFAERITSNGSSQQAVHQDSRIHLPEDRWECNRGYLVKDEPSKGAKNNTVESDEPEFSSDSDGYHNEKTVLSKMRNEFVCSQCTQRQDSLATVNDIELNLCVKCGEGGKLLVCSSDACPLVVHESCVGSGPSFDDEGNFYCPFCAYSRAISECLELKKRVSRARKYLATFSFGARRQSKKSSQNSRTTKHKQSKEDGGMSRAKNNKNSLNEVKEPGSAPVDESFPNANVTRKGSPQPEACAPPEENSEDEDMISSRYFVRFRNADKNDSSSDAEAPPSQKNIEYEH